MRPSAPTTRSDAIERLVPWASEILAPTTRPPSVPRVRPLEGKAVDDVCSRSLGGLDERTVEQGAARRVEPFDSVAGFDRDAHGVGPVVERRRSDDRGAGLYERVEEAPSV